MSDLDSDTDIVDSILDDLTDDDLTDPADAAPASRAKLIRQDFPQVAPDCFIVIRNPFWAPPDRLAPKREPKVNKQGHVDKKDAARVGADWVLWFIDEWQMYPVMTDADWDIPGDWNPEPLGPPSMDTVLKMPADVQAWVVREILGARRPS